LSQSQKPITVAQVEDSVSAHGANIAMQQRLRQAIFDSISESDVAAIVQKQVEKAKLGDENSLQFVMKYVLGFGQPINYQQTNLLVTDVATAARIASSGKVQGLKG
jgi:hypothetical protein